MAGTAPYYDGVLLPGGGGIVIPTEVFGSGGAGTPGGKMSLVKSVSHSYASAHADYTLLPAEINASEIVLTSANAASNLILPAAYPGKEYIVYNNSGQTITFKVSGQTGVAITNGARAVVVCESGDIQRVTADQTSGGSVPSGPAPIAAGATLTLTAASSGATILLNQASGSVVTLPAATGTGNRYRFVVTVAPSSAKHAILAASSSDFINGIATGENTSTAKVFVSAPATNHSIQMPFSGSQPSGGFIGDSFTAQDIATNLWQIDGTYQAGTTPTTPYSSATS